MAAPVVLLYNLNSEKGRRIRLLCAALKLRSRHVLPEEYGLSLGELAEGAAPKEGPEERALPEEMLVMACLSRGQLDQLLAGFRQKKILPVALKAVLTPTNAAWDSFALRDELSREREAIRQSLSAREADSAAPEEKS